MPEVQRDLATGNSPTSIALAGNAVLWTDVTGGIWTMGKDGSAPHALSDQKAPGFAFHLIEAGRTIFATSRGDLLRVGLPDGPVVRAQLALPEYPESSAADAEFVYLTMFKRPEIMRVPVAGGSAIKIAELPRAILAVHGHTLYAASYSTGTLLAITVATKASRIVARNLPRPTAIAADATHVYIYCERDQTLRRIEIATGTSSTLATHLINSDDLELDGAYVYTRTWGPRPALVRVAKTGSSLEILAELSAPTDIAIDAESIYVTSRDGNKIVRVPKPTR